MFDVADLRLDVIATQLGGVVLARLGTAGQPRRQAFGHRLRHPGAHNVGSQLGRDLVVGRIGLQRFAVAQHLDAGRDRLADGLHVRRGRNDHPPGLGVDALLGLFKQRLELVYHPALWGVDLDGARRLYPLAVAVNGQLGQFIRRHRHPVLAVMALQVDDAETVAPAAAVHRVIEADDEQFAGHFLVDFRQAQDEAVANEQQFIDQNVQALVAGQKDFDAAFRHAHAGQLADQFLAADDGLAKVILAVNVEVQGATVSNLVAVSRQLVLGAIVDQLVQGEDGELLRALRLGQRHRVLVSVEGKQKPGVVLRSLIIVIHAVAPLSTWCR
ncbi:hypothetical protein D3C76_612400 [compost metagenome]